MDYITGGHTYKVRYQMKRGGFPGRFIFNSLRRLQSIQWEIIFHVYFIRLQNWNIDKEKQDFPMTFNSLLRSELLCKLEPMDMWAWHSDYSSVPDWPNWLKKWLFYNWKIWHAQNSLSGFEATNPPLIIIPCKREGKKNNNWDKIHHLGS